MLFDILILLVVVANFAMTAEMYRRMTRHDAEDAADEAVEVATKRERDLMSEGLDNIMLFSVNGKTGMEPENWREV